MRSCEDIVGDLLKMITDEAAPPLCSAPRATLSPPCTEIKSEEPTLVYLLHWYFSFDALNAFNPRQMVHLKFPIGCQVFGDHPQ